MLFRLSFAVLFFQFLYFAKQTNKQTANKQVASKQTTADVINLPSQMNCMKKYACIYASIYA